MSLKTVVQSEAMERQDPDDTPDPDGYREICEKIKGTNINAQTLLATDYLNHFNEIVMLLEMIPDMPEMMDEAKAWKPLTYQEHFRNCTFSDAALAVEAYNFVPGKYRQPFEKTVGQIDSLIQVSIARLELDLVNGNLDLARENVVALSRVIQRIQDVASSIIHGHEKAMDQDEVDALITG